MADFRGDRSRVQKTSTGSAARARGASPCWPRRRRRRSRPGSRGWPPGPVQNPLQGDAHVLVKPRGRPSGTAGQDEPVVVGRCGEFFVPAKASSARALPVPGVRDPFEEEQWEDVRLEVGRIDRAAERVRGGQKAAIQRRLAVLRWTQVLVDRGARREPDEAAARNAPSG